MQQVFNEHSETISGKSVGQQKFILGSFAIDFAVVLLWFMVRSVIHIKAHDRFRVIRAFYGVWRLW